MMNNNTRPASLSGGKRSQRSAKSQITSHTHHQKRNKEEAKEDPSYHTKRDQHHDSAELLSSLELRNGYSICPYVKRLYNMMIHSEHVSHIISWNEQGDVILIKDKALFEQDVLPKHFTCRFDSLIRQVQYYGFRKVSDHKNLAQVSFSHPYFLRHRPELLYRVQRDVPRKGQRVVEHVTATYSHDGDWSKRVQSLEEENSALRDKIQWMEGQNKLLMQTVTTISERLRRMEASSHHGQGAGSRQQDDDRSYLSPSRECKQYVPATTPITANVYSIMDDTSSDQSMAPSKNGEALSQLIPAAVSEGHDESTVFNHVGEEGMGLLSNTIESSNPQTQQDPTPSSTNNGHMDKDSSKKLEHNDDSFREKILRIVDPYVKPFHEYTKEELQEYTESFREMIASIEEEHAQRRRSSQSIERSYDDPRPRPALSLKQCKPIQRYPMRGTCVTIQDGCDVGDEALNMTTNSLSSISETGSASEVGLNRTVVGEEKCGIDSGGHMF